MFHTLLVGDGNEPFKLEMEDVDEIEDIRRISINDEDEDVDVAKSFTPFGRIKRPYGSFCDSSSFRSLATHEK